jgi:hypothetical protein
MNTDKHGWDGRAGSPLPAASTATHDGAHGVTRPTWLLLSGFIRVHPWWNYS